MSRARHLGRVTWGLPSQADRLAPRAGMVAGRGPNGMGPPCH